ncbi:MAG: sigma factor, partial [Actinomycetota bacterium]
MKVLSELEDSELFARLPDEGAREELLVRHRPLARYLARKFTGRGESLEDLEQVATLALLKAIDRLDPRR